MRRRTVEQLVLSLYPREWRRDGRTAEMAEVLIESTEVRASGRTYRAELVNLAVHAAGARLRWWLPAAARQAVAALCAVTGGGLAVALFLFGEWQPWSRVRDTWTPDQVGPFLTLAVVPYLATAVAAFSLWLLPARLTRIVGSFAIMSDVCVITAPTVAPLARPSLLALFAILGLNAGIVMGSIGTTRLTTTWRLCGLAATIVFAAAVSWSIVCNTDLSYDDRGDFNWGYHGLADIAHYVPVATAATLLLAIGAAISRPQWLFAAVLVALPWALVGLRVAPQSNIRELGATAVAVWLVSLALLHGLRARRKPPVTH